MAGESKAKVIPLHSNSARASARRRAAARGGRAPAPVAARRFGFAGVGRADCGRGARDRRPPRLRRWRRGRRRGSQRAEPAHRRGRRVRPQADVGRLHGRRIRLRQAPQRSNLSSFAARAVSQLVPGRGQRDREPAGHRCGPHRRQPRGRAPDGRADGLGRRARQPSAPAGSAPAGRRHGLRHARDGAGGAQGGPHDGVHGRCPPAAGRRRAHRGVPRGLQGSGQELPRPLQAAALRPRRVRLRRIARARTDRAVLDRRVGGDLSDARRREAAGPAARACRTSRSRRCSRWPGRSAWFRCRRSGTSSSASPSRPRATTSRRPTIRWSPSN